MKCTDWTSTRKMRAAVSRRFSHTAKQLEPELSFDQILAKTPLLSLPIELLQQINDFLPPSAQACFALTCHRIQAIIGTLAWKELNTNDESRRLEKILLLRLLRRDLPDTSHWLCYRCIKFHPKDALGLPTRAGVHEKGETAAPHAWFEHEYTDTYNGFPFCASTYTLAHEFMHSALRRHPHKSARGRSNSNHSIPPTPTSSGNGNGTGSGNQHLVLDAPSTYYWHGHAGDSAIGMDYKLFPRVSGTKFLLFSSHRFHVRNFHHLSPAYLASLNFDICPHHSLAPDFVPGDGSLADRL
ncbi:hypothetical protein AOQ84DRAFT_373104, partial [Glonium stellatum]